MNAGDMEVLRNSIARATEDVERERDDARAELEKAYQLIAKQERATNEARAIARRLAKRLRYAIRREHPTSSPWREVLAEFEALPWAKDEE